MPVETDAIVLRGVNEPFKLERITLSDAGEGELMIKITAVGVCHSDLSVQSGSIPAVFPCVVGHEGAGVVHQVGPGVQSFKVGDAVLLSLDHCGACRNCRKKKSTACLDWTTLNLSFRRPSDGSYCVARDQQGQEVKGMFFGQSSFSQYTLAAVNSCTKVSKDVDLSILAPLGCGIQTGVGTVINKLRPEPNQTIGIWGMGGVGLSAVMGAKHANLKTIVAVDIVQSRLDLAKELGATHCINGRDSDVKEQIAKATSGEMLDFVVEASGNQKCLNMAWNCLGMSGVHAQLAGFTPGTKPDIDLASMMAFQKTFMGVIEGEVHPPDFLPKLVEMHQTGHLPLEKICRKYHYTEFQQAMDAMHDGSVIKPILTFE